MNDSNKYIIGKHSNNLKDEAPHTGHGSHVERQEKEPCANNFNPESIYDVQRKWQNRRADVRLAVAYEPGKPPQLEIDFIGIPKASRCKGYGSKLIRELMRAADSKKMDIALTPERSSRSERGKKFFMRHGFKQATSEDGPSAWMVRKAIRRERPKNLQSQASRRREVPEPKSLFMENAKKFREGDKSAFSNYGGSGKIGHGASGSKSSYGFFAGEQEHEKRPPYPADVPAGCFASWNEQKKEYEIIPKRKGYGGVVFNDNGEVLLRMDAAHSNDHIWTFPMGPAGENETPEEAARREVEESTGVKAGIRSQVPGIFEDDQTEALFYFMQIISDGHPVRAEAPHAAWVKLGEAQAYLSQTSSERARKRDALLLEAALRYTEQAFEEKVRESFLLFVKDLPARSMTEESPARDDHSAAEKEASKAELESMHTDDKMGDGECAGAVDAQNALIYWGRKEHRANYSAGEQREILARLLMAAQAHGIDPESLRRE